MRTLFFSLLIAAAGSAETPCEGVKSVALPHTTITAAESVARGPRAGANARQASLTLPAHCRVTAVLAPTSDSHIEMELWMPSSGWNGKFEAVGNGGWAGSLDYASMTAALMEGYATVSTDTGHKSSETPGGSFALGHPEKLIDYGYRAVHEVTVASKALVSAFYGKQPKLSYWNSCSNGGRQGLMEAQRYPTDFDGIVAGAPAANWTGRALSSLWVAQAVHKEEASYIPPAKYPVIHDAVLAACDAVDGVRDGLLEDPTRCKFDPGVLRCEDKDGPACLTPAQVETARRIYTAATYPGTKEEFYPGLAFGSELGWATYAGPAPFSAGIDHGRFVIFKDPAWNYKTMAFDSELRSADRIDSATVNALNPDLRAFFKHGGKLIQYHGWSDPQIPPMHSVNYYKSVVSEVGKVDDSYRLFMAPGMAHCGGGAGPNQFDAIGALEQWRESGTTPDQMAAKRVSNGKVEMTRPLCPYPQVAKYKGSGSTNDAANFACKTP